MKKFKVILCIILAFIMIATMCACGGDTVDTNTPADGTTPPSSGDNNENEQKQEYTETYNIIYATPDAQGSIFDEMLIIPMGESLAKHSNGRITLETYYSGTLAGQGSILTALDSKSCDLGGDAPSMYAGVYLYSELINTPGIDYGGIENYTKLINDYDDIYRDEGLEKYYMFSRFAAGMFGFATTDKMIETLEDAKGLAFRATGNVIPYTEALGSTGTFIPLSELYESLRLNVVDGAITTLDRIASDSYFDVCDYFTKITWFFGDHIEVMDQDFYDAMDPEAQAAVDKASEDMLEFALEWNRYTVDNCRKMCEDGNPNFKYIEVDEEQRALFTDAASEILQSKVDELNAAGLDGNGAVEWLKTNAQKYI